MSLGAYFVSYENYKTEKVLGGDFGTDRHNCFIKTAKVTE